MPTMAIGITFGHAAKGSSIRSLGLNPLNLSTPADAWGAPLMVMMGSNLSQTAAMYNSVCIQI